MSINQKYVKNSDLLGANFHTVTKRLSFKKKIRYDIKILTQFNTLNYALLKLEKIFKNNHLTGNFSKSQKSRQKTLSWKKILFERLEKKSPKLKNMAFFYKNLLV